MADSPISRVWTEPHLKARTEQIYSQLAGTSTQQLPRAINDLLAFHQYPLIIRLLDAVHREALLKDQSWVIPQHHERILKLATLGNAVINLNLQDVANFVDTHVVNDELEAALLTLSWPKQAMTNERGPLHDLVPTYQLLLEVIEILAVRGEVAMALSVLHLVAEYLPLLAWQSTLGHAGDPVKFEAQLNAPTTRWNQESCPLNRQERHAFASVSVALESDAKWKTYLKDGHSRVAGALIVCGGVPEPASTHNGQRTCRNPCSVMSGDKSLSWKTVLIRRFKESAVLTLRHDSPVGHFFSVPSEVEILATWETSWEGFLAHRDEAPHSHNPLVHMNRSGALPGLYEFIGFMADLDGPMEPSNVLGSIADRIRLITNEMTL